jgi:DNA-binding transcriptional MocR family regulator
VRSGRIAPGAAVPTVRELARALRVSPTTVAAAYGALRTRGLLAGDGRRGTRVTHRPPLPTRSPAVVPQHLRNLADGNPDPDLLPVLRTPLSLPYVRPRLYGEGVNDTALLERAGRHFADDGIEGDLAVAGGGLDGIERVLQAHLRAGDRVAVEDPAFTGVLDLVSALGLVPEPVAVDDRGPRPAELERALDARVQAVIVTPRAQNPTGAAIDRKRARELHAVLSRHPDVLVVEDDHAGPVAGEPAVTLTRGRARFAVVRSVSKWLGPDLRLAFLAGDSTTVARVEGRQRLGTGWVSHVLQQAVLALWKEGEEAGRFRTAAEAYSARRERLIRALDRREIRAFGRSGLNVWVPVAEESSVVTALAEKGWAVRAGEPYRLRSAPGIRVTVSNLKPSEADRLAADLAESLRPAARTSTT